MCREERGRLDGGAVEERGVAEKLSDIYDDEERSTGMEEEKLAFFKQVNWAKDIGCEKGI